MLWGLRLALGEFDWPRKGLGGMVVGRSRLGRRAVAACVAAGVLLLAACVKDEGAGGDESGGWPDGPVTLLVPFGQGGFVDTAARAVAQHLPATLGVPVAVENREGASGQVGHAYFLTRPPDGNTILYTAVTPYLPLNIILTGADFSIDDFHVVNIQTCNIQAVWVPADSPWQSLADLVTDLRAKPGEFSAGASFGGPGHLATVVLTDALGLDPKEDINMVLTDGGSEAQALLGGGHVDLSILNVHDTDAGLGDAVRALAVLNDEPVPGTRTFR